MTTMKKIVVSVFVLSLGIVAGCSGADSSDVSGTGTNSSASKQGEGSSSSSGSSGSSGSTESTKATVACTTIADWSQTDSKECSACADLNCSSARRAFEDVVSSCERQYVAALKCSTCGCIDNAITNKGLCRDPFDKYITCVTSKCEAPCK